MELFLNPDSVLTEGSLRRMMDVLESDPSIGMVGGLLCNPDGSEQPGGTTSVPYAKASIHARLRLVAPWQIVSFTVL